jgi:hypothetical protein
MKTRNYILAIIALLVVVLVSWVSCEKEGNELVLKEARQTTDFEIPAEVAACFTPDQIDQFYAEVEKEATILPPDYYFVPITIKMKNEVRKIYADNGNGNQYDDVKDWVIGLEFEGNGIWKEMGSFLYTEKITFLLDEGNSENPYIGSKGEGSIFLNRIPSTKTLTPSRENILMFDSKDRMLVNGMIKPKEDRPMPVDDGARLAQKNKYKSSFAFNGGYGIFDRSYGYATKVEFYDLQEPGVCTAAILGYVFVKRDVPPKEDEVK